MTGRCNVSEKQIVLQNPEPRSVVWRPDPEDGFVYKRQMKTLCDNEQWCLQGMRGSGYVPDVKRLDIEVMATADLGVGEKVTNPEVYLSHVPRVLVALKQAGIRHGDLTEYSVIPYCNIPFLIDFAESRLWDDPRPDKRPEGDEYWLSRTMRKQAVHNWRAPEIWEAIKRHVDFKGKSVVDEGCGGGDMLLYAHHAGACEVVGIDSDLDVLTQTRERIQGVPGITTWYLELATMEKLEAGLEETSIGRCVYDIALCLSVLPYVSDMEGALRVLQCTAEASIIECQYEGDGPGVVKDDAEMLSILRGYWGEVRQIGQTHVEERDKWRTIWLCS